MTASTPRTRWGKAALWVRFYVGRSVALDRETLHLHRWGARERAAFLASKAAALPALQAGRTATVRAGDVHFRATSPLDLGTFQTCLLDVHDVVVVPAVLDGTPAPVVVDVGANVGQFAAATRAFVPDAQIVSVEPDPDTHAKLRHNLAGFPGARSHQVAVGEERAVMTLHRHHVSVMATLRPGEVEDYDPELTVDVDVRPPARWSRCPHLPGRAHRPRLSGRRPRRPHRGQVSGRRRASCVPDRPTRPAGRPCRRRAPSPRARVPRPPRPRRRPPR